MGTGATVQYFRAFISPPTFTLLTSRLHAFSRSRPPLVLAQQAPASPVANGGGRVRPGLPVDGGQLLGPPDRYFQHAPALFRVTEGRDPEGVDGHGTRPVPAHASLEAGYAAFARTETAGDLALGLESLRGAEIRVRQPCGNPRSRRRRAALAPDASGQAFYGRGAGTDAHGRL